MQRRSTHACGAFGVFGGSFLKVLGAAGVVAFVSGAVCSAQTVWTTGSTVTLTTTFTVTDTLTIEPGVTVRMGTDAAFVVGPTGTLLVNGTQGTPVRFQPQGSVWAGMRFEPGSNGEITGALIERFRENGIEIIDASPVIQNSTIRQLGPFFLIDSSPSGIRVRGSDASPIILGCTIESIVGSPGTTGSSGSFGDFGSPGADGELFSPNGSMGGSGSPGGAGGTGGEGRAAYGILVSQGARATIGYNTIRNIRGGVGGTGGNGGTGGGGGRGGAGLNSLTSGGNGGAGGSPGFGGPGGIGGVGGRAEAIRIESATDDLYAFQNLIYNIEAGAGGTGGRRGNGGRGGDGGRGGNCTGLFCTAGNGGSARNGGSAGNLGGTGGAGGQVAALGAFNNAQTVSFVSNTVADMLPGAGGSGGQGGSGGPGGFGGAGGTAPSSGTNGSSGSNGSTGPSSASAGPGAGSQRTGVLANGNGAQVEAFNNIFALGAPGSGVVFRSESGALITVNYNNYSAGSLSSGSVVIGSSNIFANPQFVDQTTGNFRLTSASPGVDAGSNALVPPDFLDLNGNADTTEPIPFDLDGNPRIAPSAPGGVATVDMGAYEGVFTTQIYRREAAAWMAAAPSEAYAFDEFFPGIAGAGGCLVGDPSGPVVIALDGGTLTVSSFQGNNPVCAITDASGAPAVSDVNLDNSASNGLVVFEFDPPVTGFYTYFGSLAIGATATMDLFIDEGAELEFLQSITTLPSTNAILAGGLGFRSAIPVRRVEVTTTEVGALAIGAFVGLVGAETSLGSVEIDGYSGPSGPIVQYDFACAFVPRPTCAPDVTGDGVVNFADLNSVLSSFGQTGDDLPADTNADGVVNFADLNTVLGAFGTDCPD